MNHKDGSETDKQRRREEQTEAEARRMLENTRRFLEQLADAPPESRQYVSGLKEHLENEVRHLKARRRDNPERKDPQH